MEMEFHFTQILSPAQFATHDAGAAVEVFLPSGSIGIATPVIGATNLFSITAPTLVDALYSVTAAVRINDAVKSLAANSAERTKHSGRGDRSVPLLVTIDTVAPNPPSLELDPAATDTGIPTNPGSYSDRITRSTTPGLFGFAEEGSWLTFAADGNPISNGVVDASDVFGGQAIAIPSDSRNASTLMVGTYRHVLTLNLNDSTKGFPVDGQRQISALLRT